MRPEQNRDPRARFAQSSALTFEPSVFLPGRYSDSQELEYAGYAVARGGHSGVDAAVEAWLAEDPVPLRLSIVAWFLWRSETSPTATLRYGHVHD